MAKGGGSWYYYYEDAQAEEAYPVKAPVQVRFVQGISSLAWGQRRLHRG